MAQQQNLYTSSAIVNGQLVPATRTNNYYPSAVGPIIQGVPAGPQQSAGTGYTGAGGGPIAGDAVAQDAAANPFDFVKSPVPLMIIMFVGGFLMLRYVHYPY